MSGHHGPSPNQSNSAVANFQTNPNQARAIQSFTETIDFSVRPADLSSPTLYRKSPPQPPAGKNSELRDTQQLPIGLLDRQPSASQLFDSQPLDGQLFDRPPLDKRPLGTQLFGKPDRDKLRSGRQPPTPATSPFATRTVASGWHQKAGISESLLSETPILYPQPTTTSTTYEVRRLLPAGAAIASVCLIVILLGLFGLRFGSDQGQIAARSSGSFDSAGETSSGGLGPSPNWDSGSGGVLDSREITEENSDVPTNHYTASPRTRPSSQVQPNPLSPVSSLPRSLVEKSDVSIGSNTSLETENAASKVAADPKVLVPDAGTSKLKSIEPGQTVAAAFFANCTEARAVGAAPIAEGSLGYRKALDADNDGIACETGTSTNLTAPDAQSFDSDLPAVTVAPAAANPWSSIDGTTTTRRVAVAPTTTRPSAATERTTTRPSAVRQITTQRPTTERSTTRRSTAQSPTTRRSATTHRSTTERSTTRPSTTMRSTIRPSTTMRSTTRPPTTVRSTTMRRTTTERTSPTTSRVTTSEQPITTTRSSNSTTSQVASTNSSSATSPTSATTLISTGGNSQPGDDNNDLAETSNYLYGND